MGKMLVSLALALLCTAVVAQRTPCTGRYAALGTQDGVDWSAQWTVSPDSSSISFTVMARTDGYVAIGFSETPNMINSDIIVGAANSTLNMSYVSDRNVGNVRAPPGVDDSQDIMNATAQEVLLNGSIYTIVTFSRPLNTRDVNDVALDVMDTVYILYAWGTEVNFLANDSGSIMQHGAGPLNRGVSAMPINFICPPPAVFIPSDCSGRYFAEGTRGGVEWNAMWTVSADNLTAMFTVMAQTTGWVAIGFSEDRAMPATDVIVGAAGLNFSYVSDRYAFDRAPPSVDEIQDVDLQSAMAQEIVMDGNTYTVFSFITPLDRSNQDDVTLLNGNRDEPGVYILYAWGMENNGNASDPLSIRAHGLGNPANRGISSDRINIVCDAVAPPAAVPGGASTPIATAFVVMLALIAVIATLF